jgi:hypothetical protein
VEQLLIDLMRRLETIGDHDRSLYDTVVREKMCDPIFYLFIKPKPDYIMPDDYGMSGEANRVIKGALRDYVEGALALAPSLGLDTFHKRLAAFQNETVRTDRTNSGLTRRALSRVDDHMSVHLYVFLRDSDLPTQEEWQRAVQDAGHDLFFDSFSPKEHAGFLPMQLDGEECGFEYSFRSIEEGEGEEVDLGDRSHVVELSWHSSILDLRAVEIAASTLTELCNGIFLDPQSGAHAEGKAVHGLVTVQRSAEQDRKLAEAERKWAKVTERRCPECNARCPEYRGSCWVCGFEIGRAPG